MSVPPPEMAVIGVGGNVGTEDEIRTRFSRARDAFRQYANVSSASLYRTAPIGPEQSDFLNTALMLQLDHGTPEELLALALEIERGLGRDRRDEQHWGPRPIDLDILVWGSRVVDTPELTIPHPRLTARRFALVPLIELLGVCTLPGFHQSLEHFVQVVEAQRLELVTRDW